jgi:hypothetical protein
VICEGKDARRVMIELPAVVSVDDSLDSLTHVSKTIGGRTIVVELIEGLVEKNL